MDIVPRQPGFAVPQGGRARTMPNGEQRCGGRAVPDGQPCLRASPLEALDSVGAVLSCRRGQEVYRRNDAADHWYRVVSGLAKEQALLPDGRHQIVDFLLPGDCFGFGVRNQHRFAAEAVVNGTVLVSYPRREIEMLAERDPSVAMLICQLAIATMSRSQARTLTLGRTRAPQKVGAFLLEMAERMSERQADTITLPMSRYDIADYLGLSVETVSRCLTKLKCRYAIRLTSTRCFRILAPEVLDLG
ncbi:helix-turn-helix domain-containing protein [Falsiroseomonas sp. HW251]|uniref:helix-turn-helix domain-containing protein n=1 Tax=Falsiroseomonas sp. HW251 TaxID=3390998 RepID=UPI003D312FED